MSYLDNSDSQKRHKGDTSERGEKLEKYGSWQIEGARENVLDFLIKC